MRANRTAVRDFAVCVRSPRSSRAGRRLDRKNCLVVITLAGSVTASGSAAFRLLTLSR